MNCVLKAFMDVHGNSCESATDENLYMVQDLHSSEGKGDESNLDSWICLGNRENIFLIRGFIHKEHTPSHYSNPGSVAKLATSKATIWEQENMV